MRLLAYQVNELGNGLADFRGEMARSVGRIERKMDDNLETTMGHYADLDAKVQRHETWIATQREGQMVLARSKAEGFTDFQKVGIAAGVLVGVGGMFIAFLAIVATVLLNVL